MIPALPCMPSWMISHVVTHHHALLHSHACQIAGIFEFLGAMVLGGETTKTVASDIANLSLFKDVPEIYMYGMLCSIAVAGTWLLIATYWCLPVSTTHSISEY